MNIAYLYAFGVGMNVAFLIACFTDREGRGGLLYLSAAIVCLLMAVVRA